MTWTPEYVEWGLLVNLNLNQGGGSDDSGCKHPNGESTQMRRRASTQVPVCVIRFKTPTFASLPVFGVLQRFA